MSGLLLRRTLAAARWRLLAVAVGLAAWGATLPVIYATFGADFRELVEQGYFGELFDVFAAFGGGSVFTLDGAVSLGLIHPIPLALVAVFAIGQPIAALAGERQRGTLEVLLARPLSRAQVALTALVATVILVVAGLAANLAGVVVAANAFDVAADLRADRILVAWGNAALLYVALAAITLAASASFDRVGPPLGIAIGVTLVGYAVEFLGSIWPDLAGLRPWSVFRYFQPAAILAGDADPRDAVVLVAVAAAATGIAVLVFGRRDLAAPS